MAHPPNFWCRMYTHRTNLLPVKSMEWNCSHTGRSHSTGWGIISTHCDSWACFLLAPGMAACTAVEGATAWTPGEAAQGHPGRCALHVDPFFGDSRRVHDFALLPRVHPTPLISGFPELPCHVRTSAALAMMWLHYFRCRSSSTGPPARLT